MPSNKKRFKKLDDPSLKKVNILSFRNLQNLLKKALNMSKSGIFEVFDVFVFFATFTTKNLGFDCSKKCVLIYKVFRFYIVELYGNFDVSKHLSKTQQTVSKTVRKPATAPSRRHI